MKNKYRIVSDKYAGYEVQIKYWFFPLFWIQLTGDYCPFLNTNISIEQAKRLIEKHRLGSEKRKVYHVE